MSYDCLFAFIARSKPTRFCLQDVKD